MRTWTLTLPWTSVPLSMNSRDHWARKAHKTRTVRNTVAVLARSARIPALDRCDVTLTYHPADKRRRDADNLVATFKVACDALVDAGVVADDTPDLMTKHMPVIGPGRPGGLMTLTVTEVTP